MLRFAVLHLHDALVGSNLLRGGRQHSQVLAPGALPSLTPTPGSLAAGPFPRTGCPEGVGFVLDLSEPKRAEEALRELASDFAHMNRLPLCARNPASWHRHGGAYRNLKGCADVSPPLRQRANRAAALASPLFRERAAA